MMNEKKLSQMILKLHDRAEGQNTMAIPARLIRKWKC